jgi:hypothetical protein
MGCVAPGERESTRLILIKMLKQKFSYCSENELVSVNEMEFQLLFINFIINEEYLKIKQSDGTNLLTNRLEL